MGTNLDNIKWIKTVIMNKWPTVLKDGGADVDNDGKIEESEKFQDFNKNGVVGDDEDFLYYLELNSKAIAKDIEFVDLGAGLKPDNPIHSFLLAKPEDKLRETYKIITAIMTELGGQLTSQKLLTALGKYPNLDSESKVAVIDAVAFEYAASAGPYILNMTKILYNQSAQLLRDKKYTDSQQYIASALVYANILENKGYDSVKTAEIKKIKGDLYLLSSMTYSVQAKNTEALADIDKALAVYTENDDQANAYLKRVDIFIQQNEWEKATQDCDKALSLATENVTKAQVYFRSGLINYKNALALLNTAVDNHNSRKYSAALEMYNRAEEAFLKAIDDYKNAAKDASLKADADERIQRIRKILDNDLKADRSATKDAQEKAGN